MARRTRSLIFTGTSATRANFRCAVEGTSTSWWRNPASEMKLSPRFSSPKLLSNMTWLPSDRYSWVLALVSDWIKDFETLRVLLRRFAKTGICSPDCTGYDILWRVEVMKTIHEEKRNLFFGAHATSFKTIVKDVEYLFFVCFVVYCYCIWCISPLHKYLKYAIGLPLS